MAGTIVHHFPLTDIEVRISYCTSYGEIVLDEVYLQDEILHTDDLYYRYDGKLVSFTHYFQYVLDEIADEIREMEMVNED